MIIKYLSSINPVNITDVRKISDIQYIRISCLQFLTHFSFTVSLVANFFQDIFLLNETIRVYVHIFENNYNRFVMRENIKCYSFHQFFELSIDVHITTFF